jgi:MFS family permease
VPVSFAMQHFGPWRTQLAIGLICSIAVGLIPFAAKFHFYALLALRGILGLSTTNLFPLIAAISTNWAPETEKGQNYYFYFKNIFQFSGTFLAILTGYIQLTVVLSMPLSGFLADNCTFLLFNFI